MLFIQTILFPTDFSDHSERALELARALARDYGARLVLLHVAAPPELASEAALVFRVWFEQAELKRKLRRLVAAHANLRPEHCFEQGDAAAEILRVAREERADLIVMGTHGRTGLGRLLMGSVAEQVLRRAPCPVLTVKKSSSETTSG